MLISKIIHFVTVWSACGIGYRPEAISSLPPQNQPLARIFTQWEWQVNEPADSLVSLGKLLGFKNCNHEAQALEWQPASLQNGIFGIWGQAIASG